MTPRALTLTVAVTVVAFAGACAKPVPRVAGAAAPVVDRSPSASPTASPAASTGPASASASPSASASASSGPAKPATRADPCPVSSATLYRELRANGDMLDRGGNPTALARPTCYRGFAIAQAVNKPSYQGELPGYLFKYDAGTTRWKVLNLGTGGVCEGYAPADVWSHLGGGC
jgi:hypothetical protein